MKCHGLARGYLRDRGGPRKFILGGIVIVAFSYFLASRMTSLWQLYFSLSVLTGIGVAAFLISVVATVTRWFGGKSALAIGIVVSGFSAGGIILPPVTTYLILRYSWEVCFVVLGVAALVLGILAWYFIKTPPSTAAQPLTKSGKEGGVNEVVKTSIGGESDYTLSEALRTVTLWNMLLIYIIFAGCYQMVVIHIVPAATDAGITPQAAALVLSLSATANTLGRVLIGGIATKIGNKITLIVCSAVQVLMLFTLARTSDLYAFYTVGIIYGLAYGGVSPITPAMAGSFFGIRSMGAIYGALNTAYTAGAAIGPFVAGYIFDVAGSYTASFYSAAVAVAIAFLLCILLKPPPRKTALAQL